jgi:hypothetical protein
VLSLPSLAGSGASPPHPADANTRHASSDTGSFEQSIAVDDTRLDHPLASEYNPNMRSARSIIVTLALIGCGQEGEPAMPSDGWSGTPPAEPIALGGDCESPWLECVEGSYCKVHAGELPMCEGIGACESLPASCEPNDEPVCGCDGQLYEHACAAAQAAVNLQPAEACPSPTGRFPCGGQFCEAATQYCKYVWGHGGPPSWDCLALVCDGGLSGCDCITSPSPCGDPEWFPGQFCDDLANGGTLLQCVPS